MEARGTDAGRDAIVVGRQLGVVLLEHVQPLGSPLYGIVSAAELVVPLSALEGARACVGLVAHLVEPLGESYVALVVLQVPVVALLKELGRGVFPAASWHIVVRVRHLDSKPRRTVFGPSRRWVRLRCSLQSLLFIFYLGGAALIRRFLNMPVQSFRPPAARGFFALLPSTRISDYLRDLLASLRFPLQSLALSLRELEQERFPFLQELQALLGELGVTARYL